MISANALSPLDAKISLASTLTVSSDKNFEVAGKPAQISALTKAGALSRPAESLSRIITKE